VEAVPTVTPFNMLPGRQHAGGTHPRVSANRAVRSCIGRLVGAEVRESGELVVALVLPHRPDVVLDAT
jgi:hypothetical protein